MEKKFYVAIHDNEIHHFDEWPLCKEFVEGRKNVKYKGFKDKLEAKKFIDNNVKQPIPFNLEGVLYVYVDGSRFVTNEGGIVYSYGLCAVMNGQVVHEDFGMDCDENTSKMHHIGGELTGALKGARFAIDRGQKRVVIVYDYFGIEMWANGSWSIEKQNPFVKDYVARMNEFKEKINIDFIHVNSHVKSSEKKDENRFNDRADALARQAYQHLRQK